jgi:hypothetical protein
MLVKRLGEMGSSMPHSVLINFNSLFSVMLLYIYMWRKEYRNELLLKIAEQYL